MRLSCLTILLNTIEMHLPIIIRTHRYWDIRLSACEVTLKHMGKNSVAMKSQKNKTSREADS